MPSLRVPRNYPWWTIANAVAVSLLLTSGALAQNLSVVSGDNQVIIQSNASVNPLVVVARDNAGHPMAGVSVSWSISGAGHLTPGNQTTTDSNGQTSVHFVGDWDSGGAGFKQSTIVASAGSSSVSMYAITTGVNPSNGAEFVRAEVLTPTLADVLSPPAAGGQAAFVEVQFTSNAYQGSLPVPNVGIRLIPDDPSGPSLACAEGTQISGANGIAHCVVVFGGSAGSGLFSIEVGGGFRTFGPFHFSVTQAQAQPSVIRITGGNNQAGLPGVTLPTSLAARVEDASGHALGGVPVTWQAVVPGSVTLTNVVSISDSNGMISAKATLGNTVGTAQVQVRTASGGQAIFTLTVRQPAPTGPSAPVSALRILSGNNQTGAVGTKLAAALTARVEDAAGNPMPNVTVTWKPSPSVSLSSTVSTSDSAGIVSTFATPTANTIPVQVDLQAQGAVQTVFGAAVVTLQVTFNITISGSTSTPPTPGSGPPSGIRILTGNNQSGPIGTALPIPLTARIEDAAGNPLPNVQVTWKPSTSVTLSSIVSMSNSSGIVTATATPTSATGSVQVDLQAQGVTQTVFGPTTTTVQVTFYITISATPPPVVTPPVVTPSGTSTGYIAHIADGSEWKTTITVVNLLSTPQRVTLTFWSDSGQKWSLPIAGLGPTQQTFFDLQPNASAFLETSGTAAAVSTGWATVEGSVSGSGGVGASAIFRSHVTGRQDLEAVSAMSGAFAKGVILPFDNRNGFATGIAIANTGVAGIAPITIRDEVGSVLVTENITLGADAHLSFSLAQRYPMVVGRAGTVEIGSSSAAALGLRFNPSGSFTSVPPIPKP